MDKYLSKRLFVSWSLAGLFTCLFVLCSTTQSATASEVEVDVWDAFASGKAIAIMRHAIAPGTGDPTEFKLGDCKTQRNLSKEGQTQAQQIGLQFKERGLEHAEIYSSQWCRCVDTAANLDLGSVQQLPMLNSFFQDRSSESAQTEQLTQWMLNRLTTNEANAQADEQKAAPAILVTHQVNITALTGVFPSSGEVVFVTVDNNALTVLATWLAEL